MKTSDDVNPMADYWHHLKDGQAALIEAVRAARKAHACFRDDQLGVVRPYHGRWGWEHRVKVLKELVDQYQADLDELEADLDENQA